MSQKRALAGTTILVVEDEYLIADDLRHDLVEQGAIVLGPVATIDAALAVLDQTRPDLSIVDINLRGDPAFPVADRLVTLGVPYVFATGYDAAAVPERFSTAARHEKPIRSAQLLDTLARLWHSTATPASMPAPGCPSAS
jgi:CheY-like chemotaxis protein